MLLLLGALLEKSIDKFHDSFQLFQKTVKTVFYLILCREWLLLKLKRFNPNIDSVIHKLHWLLNYVFIHLLVNIFFPCVVNIGLQYSCSIFTLSISIILCMLCTKVHLLCSKDYTKRFIFLNFRCVTTLVLTLENKGCRAGIFKKKAHFCSL